MSVTNLKSNSMQTQCQMSSGLKTEIDKFKMEYSDNAPPVFTSKLKSVDALEGQKAELAVKVIGYPKPEI